MVVDEQPFAVAVIVNVVVWEVICVFAKVPEIVEPLPLAAIPVRFAVLFLVQLKVVPGILFGFEMLICEIAVPEQIVCAAGETLTFGIPTIMVTVFEVAGLPEAHNAFEVSTQVTASPFAGV